MKYSLLAVFFCFTLTVVGQDKQASITVELSTDTVYLGNIVGVKYSIKNIEGDFQPPEFQGMTLAGGPMVSSSFSMINGDVTQSASYEYLLHPEEEGEYIIPGAVVVNNEESYSSDQVVIYVVPNPEGITQNHRNYRIRSIINSSLTTPRDSMSRADSIRMKLRNVKSRKI